MLIAGSLLSALLAAPPQEPPKTRDDAPRVEWQRNLADALAVQKATGLPLLIAVNMDGEVFNEQFARNVYRSADFVAMTRGYVCVVASPDRHTERDYDAAGNRIECPRFRGCTCSEHINIEPELFRRWFNGTRNAPRHVGVSPDGKVLFDRFLDQSMETAIRAIEKHKGTPKDEPLPADPTALFARRDAAARLAVEGMWRRGDAATKRSVLTAAAAATNEPFDLLRAALRTEDGPLGALAAAAIAATATKEVAVDVEDALARCEDPAVTKLLLERLAALGKNDAAAARIAKHIEVAAKELPAGQPWTNPWRARAFDPTDRAAVEAELDRCEAALKAKASDDDARLALAVGQLALGDLIVQERGKNAQYWFDDALTNARKVRRNDLAAEANAAIAFAAHMLGDGTTAGRAMTGAVVNGSPRQPDPFLATVALEIKLKTLHDPVFADAKAAETRDLSAVIGGVNGVLNLLATRGALREQAALGGAALLEVAGCRAAARVRLGAAVETFPWSQAVHDRWRTRLLIDLGIPAMQRAYARHIDAAKDKPTAQWFAGYASLQGGDQYTRDKLIADALAAYGEAIALFDKSVAGNADFADTAHHWMVLALASRAELLREQGRLEAAVDDLLRAASLREASLDESDGLQRKPRAIAGRVAAALEKAGKPELAAKLKPLLP